MDTIPTTFLGDQGVFHAELEEIGRRRAALAGAGPGRPRLSDEERGRLKQELCGLALSGGGIRSATFSLGVLQAMHACGVLRVFD